MFEHRWGQKSLTPEDFDTFHAGKLAEINSYLTQVTNQNQELPCYGEEEIRTLLANRTDILDTLRDTFRLIGPDPGNDPEVFTHVPPIERFTSLPEISYKGADGNNYRRLVKYVPVHIAEHLHDLSNSCNEYITLHTPAGAPKRPGLIVQSGYRSPWYQAIVMLRVIEQYGSANEALRHVTISGQSQHSDPKKTAIDFMVIGNLEGKRTANPESGLMDDTLSFENSMEFGALLLHGPENGFWLPYYPDPKAPLSDLSPSGIKFEPWHWQFVGREKATELMTELHIYEAVAARREAISLSTHTQ